MWYSHRLFCRSWFLATSLLLLSLSIQAQWVRKADALRRRSEVANVVYQNKLYTFMGFGNSVLETDLSSEVYDPLTNTWKLLAPIPSGKGITHQGVVLIDNTVWHIGGRIGKNPGPLSSEIWIYTITTDTWSKGPSLKDPATGLPLPWGCCGAVLIGRTLHIFGGLVFNACNDQENYHLTLEIDEWIKTGKASWKNERKPMPLKRCHFSSVVLAGKIYVLGGQLGHDCGQQDQNFCHMYDPLTDTWTQLTNLPVARSHAEGGAFALDGKIYLVAGQQTNSINTNKVSIFDPKGKNGLGSWSEDSTFTLPNPYEGLAAKVIGNTFIYSHGGINGSANMKRETYSRSITRRPVYALGFASSCREISVQAGQIAKARNLLFTIDGSKAYDITADADWLTITKNKTGTALPSGVYIEVTANPCGLAPGTYTGTITAKGIKTGTVYSSASFCVKLTVRESETPSVIRINAGGAATTVDGINWSGCISAGTCNKYVEGGFAYTQRPLPAISNVMWPLSQAIFQSEWTGGQTNGVKAGQVAFSYKIPVANGSYLVRLHFVELNKNGPGLRQFDVNLEGGPRELISFDIFAEAGGIHKAIFRDFALRITDGEITIDFVRQIENAKISAIEIFPSGFAPKVSQAESAHINQASIAANHPGFTGSGFVDYIHSATGSIQWEHEQTCKDTVMVQFRYANGGAATRALRLEVNGTIVKEHFLFPSTEQWSTWSFVYTPLILKAGQNTIKLTANGTSGPNIDYLIISKGAILHAAQRENALDRLSSFVVIFPNPAQDMIYINGAKNSTIAVINSLGNVVMEKVSTEDPYSLPVSGLHDGWYIIQINKDGHTIHKKLWIIQ